MSKNKTNIEPITNYDPINLFLRNKLHLTPLTFGLTILVLDIIVDGWIGWYYKILNGNPGILQDYMALVTDFLYAPIIGGLYLWSITGSTSVFQKLLDSGIFKSNESMISILEKKRVSYKKRSVFYVILAASLIFAYTQAGSHLGWVPWETVTGYIYQQPYAAYYRLPFWFLMFYNLSFSVYNIGLTIATLREIFRKTDIKILPLHPDKCGGLGGINHYTNRVAVGIGAVGLLISAAILIQIQQSSLIEAYPVIIGALLYPLLAPFFFFLPLGTAHDAMQDAKDEELLSLSDKFTKAYNLLKKNISKEGSNYEKELEKLEGIQKLYNLADSFPVWPFDTNSLRKFITVVTTPLLPAIISILSEVIQNKFLS